MDVGDLVEREPAVPGEARLPWRDPVFSARMLAEHLDETHESASRRGDTIDAHTEWLARLVPNGERVLDLGCGPGLYLERLARIGWTGVGVDVSPASVAYAAERAAEAQLPCSYILGDFREPGLAGGFDLVLCLFGELSAVPLEDASAVLAVGAEHLRWGGRIVVEMSTKRGVMAKARESASWHSAEGGLFAAGRHVVLRESQWFAAEEATVERWWVLDESFSRPRMLGSTTWSHSDVGDVIADLGLVVDGRFGDLSGVARQDDDHFMTLVLKRE